MHHAVRQIDRKLTAASQNLCDAALHVAISIARVTGIRLFCGFLGREGRRCGGAAALE
jgi:hypothetical protein